MPTTYQFTTLHDGDAQLTIPNDVNNAGQVVGRSEAVLPTRTTLGTPTLGFLYADGKYSTVSVPGSALTDVQGSNDVGQLVGSIGSSGFVSTDGAFASINVAGATYTEPYGINNQGQVAGFYGDVTGAHGFLDDKGVFTSIDVPGYVTEAYGINAQGQVVGEYLGSGTHGQGFIYDHGTYVTGIDVPGATDTYPAAISDAGVIAGTYYDATDGHGFVDDNGGFTAINAPDATSTSITGLNNKGQLVGSFSTGPNSILAGFLATPVPAAITVGSGSDTLVLSVSEEAYKGDAQFTVSVDGQQFGGTLTAASPHGTGQSDAVTVLGDWNPGAHTVTVNFLNDAYDGSPGLDRNLYLDAAAYNGTAVANVAQELGVSGPVSFGVTDNTPVPPPAGTNTVIGTGSDLLVLTLYQDFWKGNATYTISIDGQQYGGTLTETALRGSGISDNVAVYGNWTAGPHAVTINFLNDAYGGTPASDRNLYVESASYDGTTIADAPRALDVNGPSSFTVNDTTPAPAPVTTQVGPLTAHDLLTLSISQDAYQGPAQFIVSVDGQQQGGVLTASALHGSGLSDAVTVLGDWAAGTHTATIDFLNDAYGGTPTTDRNLFLDSATYNGASVPGAALMLHMAGPQSIVFVSGPTT